METNRSSGRQGPSAVPTGSRAAVTEKLLLLQVIFHLTPSKGDPEHRSTVASSFTQIMGTRGNSGCLLIYVRISPDRSCSASTSR